MLFICILCLLLLPRIHCQKFLHGPYSFLYSSVNMPWILFKVCTNQWLQQLSLLLGQNSESFPTFCRDQCDLTFCPYPFRFPLLAVLQPHRPPHPTMSLNEPELSSLEGLYSPFLERLPLIFAWLSSSSPSDSLFTCSLMRQVSWLMLPPWWHS